MNAEYPKWLEQIDNKYSVIYYILFKKLDKQLTSIVKERSSKILADEFYKILKIQLESNQLVNPKWALLEAVLIVYGYEVASTKFLDKNQAVLITLKQLVNVLAEIVFLVKSQNCFAKLGKDKIHYN